MSSSVPTIEYTKGRPLAGDFSHADLPETRFEPRFGQPEADRCTALTAAENFYFLLHHDEFEAVYQPAFALVTDRLRCVRQLRNTPALLRLFRYSPEALRKRIRALGGIRDGYPGSTVSHRSQVLREFAPTALLDGCWLQHIANAATAHSEPYARLSRFYNAKLGGGEPTSSSRFWYRELLRSAGIILPATGSWAFITQARISEQAFATPVFQLALSFFPRCFLPELIGYTLGHFGGVSAIDHWAWLSRTPGEVAKRRPAGREGAIEEQTPLETMFRVVCDYLASLPDALRQRHWQRLWNGVVVQHVIEQPHKTLLKRRFTGESTLSLRAQVLAIFQAKRAFAHGHHRGAKLFGKSLAQWIDGDLDAFLSAFAQSPYVKVGDPDQSPFFRTLVSPDGPMYQVFSAEEIATLKKWVRSLEGGSAEPAVLPMPENGQPAAVNTDLSADLHWPKTRKDKLTETQSWKQVFHRLVNVDVYPPIRRPAWAFVQRWLMDTEKVLRRARPENLLRPFPYTHSAFEARIAALYSDAVSRYRPFVPPPRLNKREYQWLLEQVAPFALVDGCWLQNIAPAGCANEEVRAKLFQIYDDEIGNGNPIRNHANIFRELLRVQGMRVPTIDSPMDWNWPGVSEGNFALPNYLLAISQFPRSFFPEILGLNLAIELSGLGGFYRTLIDELRYWDIDPRFFVLHQAVDNLASGHARLAFDAIALYLDDALARSGEEEMQRRWQRIWTGFGALTVVSRRAWRPIAWAYVRRFGLRRALELWQRWRQAAAA